jgi:hypothetical protein
MLFLHSIIFRCRENKRTMDPNQVPQYNPQGFPNMQPMQWQQQNQQPMPGLQHPQPQNPQMPPPLTSAPTAQLDAMYSQAAQPGGLAPQQPAQPVGLAPQRPGQPHGQQGQQGQQGPGRFPFPPMMSQGPQHIVQQPQMVPPGLVQQPQQAQRGTPLGAGGAPGQFINPSQQQRPPTAMPSARQSVHGGIVQRVATATSASWPADRPRSSYWVESTPATAGRAADRATECPATDALRTSRCTASATSAFSPVDDAGLKLHPSQQVTPQQPSHITQNPVRLATPFTPAAPAGPSRAGSAREQDHISEVKVTASANNWQAPRASAQQTTRVPRGADMSYQHIEAFNERWCDLQVQEVMEVTSKLQDPLDDPPDLEKHLRESLKTFEEDELNRHAKERERIRATVAENLNPKGGGSRGGAGNATPRAKQSSPTSRPKSKKIPATSGPPGPSNVALSPPKDKQAPVSSLGDISNREAEHIASAEPPAARDVDLDRSKSRTPSPSHSRRRTRGGKTAVSGREGAGVKESSPRSRGRTRKWREAGLYYASGELHGGMLESARVRSKHWGPQP